MSAGPTGADPVAEAALSASLEEVSPAASATPRSRARRQLWRAVLDILHDLSVAVLFCFFLITFVVQAFRVQGTSMEPQLQDGERIIVNKFLYRFRAVARGDVVVFYYPQDPSVSFVKRVIGLPGDLVEIRRGKVVVNGEALAEPYVREAYRDADSQGPLVVRPGHYYVLGDHRSASDDSRRWGEVPERYIQGRAALRMWPPHQMGWVR